MHKVRLLTTTLVIFVLAGCGGAPGVPDSDEGDPTALSCSSVALASNAGQPLDSVPISGVSAPEDALLAARITVGEEEVGYALVQHTVDATTLSVPPHPNGTLEGGEVILTLTDGNTTCEAMPFTIEALPAAPGTTQTAADLMQTALALQAQLFGTSLEELQAATAQELPPHLLPLFSAHLILADSRNSNSVRAMLAGSSPVLGDTAEGADLVDALMAKMEVAPLLEGRVQQLQDAVSELGPSMHGASAIRSQALVYTTTPDAALLDRYMRLATFGELATDPNATKYLDAAGALLAGGAVLAGASGAKKLATLYGEVGGLLFAYQKAAEGFANLLPSEFATLTFDVTDREFWEDDDPATGRWSNASVYAWSKGWNLDKLVLDMMLNWAGQKASGGTNTHEWLKKYTSNEVLVEVVEHTDDFFASVLTAEVINGVAGDSDMVQIDPQLFGPTDIGAQEWSERYFLGSGSAAFTFIDQHTYEAVRTGTATLEIMTEPGKFGYKQIKGQEDIHMLPIEVHVTPPNVTITPGKTVTFQADVQNANDENVEWSIEPAGVHTLVVGGQNSETVSVTTSTNPDALPAVLKATSTSTAGLRADKQPERSDTATLSPNAIIVTPESACVEPGETLQFTAEYPDLVIYGQANAISPQQDADVIWDASAGSITSDGLFTAPSTHQTVTITAHDPNDPTVYGEATIQVGACTCWFNATVANPFPGAFNGPARFTYTNDQKIGVSFTRDTMTGGEGSDQFFAGFETAPGAPLTPGTYELITGSASQYLVYSGVSYPGNLIECDGCGGTIAITDATPDEIRGSLAATVAVDPYDGEDKPVLLSVQADFTAVPGSPYDPDSPYMQCKIGYVEDLDRTRPRE